MALPAAEDQRLPGLQGLRGLAITAVLLYHHDPDLVPGGFLGVSLFFTLSGFLITRLLLRERDATARISLRRFWARRVRRLAPIALTGIALGAFTAVALGTGPDLDRYSSDLVAAALNAANWRFVLAGTNYGDAFAAASPVEHYWSLAIEEQFYLVIPLAFLVLRSRRQLAAGLLVVVAGSLGAQLILDDPNRVYLGTDARASELAVGCLLAVWWTSRRSPVPAFIRGGAVLVGGAVAFTWLTVRLGSPALHSGGLLVHALASAWLVAAAASPGSVARVLGFRPLAALGDHSYGIYVFHFAIFLLLDADRMGFGGGPLLAVRVLVTIAAAMVALHLIERPVHVGGALRRWEAPVGFVTGLAAVLVVALALVSIPPIGDRADRTAQLATSTDVPVVMTAPVPPAASATDVLTDVAADIETDAVTDDDASAPDPGTAPARDASAPAGDAVAGPVTSPPAVPRPSPRLLVVGDSTAFANGVAMQTWGAETGRFTADVVGVLACTFLHDGVVFYREGWVAPPYQACTTLLTTALEVAGANAVDAIVVFMGSIQLADWILTGTVDRTGFGDPEFEERYVAAADASLAQLASAGVPVLVATVPTPAWNAPGAPGSGPVTTNDPVRAARLNQLTADVAARHPSVAVVPYAEHLGGPDGTVDPALRPDGIHLTSAAVADTLEAWLEPELRAAYARALGGPPRRETTWSG